MIQTAFSNIKTGMLYCKNNPVYIKGIDKRLKLNHWHFAFPEINKYGKFGGFHHDPSKLFHNHSNLKCLLEESKPNELYRCFIEFNGHFKECSMFPHSWTYEKTVQEIYKAIANVDFTKIPLNKNGKYDISVPFYGAYLKAHIIKTTGEISTCYITHDDWTESLAKKYFKSNK